MQTINRFDPFNNRLCRNVRNALSELFGEALETKALRPVRRVAEVFLDDAPPTWVVDYIQRRLEAFEAVLAEVSSRGLENPLDIALILWDRGLFFEMHEYLEAYWKAASGEERRLFQALIRAAGTYVHLEQGNLPGARRIAAKAIYGLKPVMDRLAPHADPNRLLDKLGRLDPRPPKLFGTARLAGADNG